MKPMIVIAILFLAALGAMLLWMPHLYISEAGMWMRYEPVFSEPRMGPWKREPHLLLLAVWVLVAFCVFIAAEAVAFAIALSRKAERHDKSILSD